MANHFKATSSLGLGQQCKQRILVAPVWGVGGGSHGPMNEESLDGPKPDVQIVSGAKKAHGLESSETHSSDPTVIWQLCGAVFRNLPQPFTPLRGTSAEAVAISCREMCMHPYKYTVLCNLCLYLACLLSTIIHITIISNLRWTSLHLQPGLYGASLTS